MELEYVSLIYVSLISEIFRRFVNTLTAGGNYSLRNSENLRQPIQMQLSNEQKTFLNFFGHFWNFEMLNILKKIWPS